MQKTQNNHNFVALHKQSNASLYIKKISYLALILLWVALPISANKSPFIHIVTENLPPYQIVTQNKTLSGFAVDIIKETMARSHYTYSMKYYPWVRSYNLAQVKANHCIFSVARLKSRENMFKWVGPISNVNNTAMWARKGRHIKISNLNDAKKYIIAVNRNDFTHIGLIERGFNEGENLYVLDDTKSLISLLMTRPEIDLIVADDTTIKFRTELAGANMSELQRIYEIKDLPLNFFFACSKKTDDNIIKHLSNKLQSVHQDGTYDIIWEKWRHTLTSPKL
ncbi:MAG: polar amino acid transport system substrate-binding protein [Colwellia sp.]